jgi:hypothetical protein
MKNKAIATIILLIMFATKFVQASDERQEQKKYHLSVGAIFKNEQKFLKEWIEYHRLVGVDHFYLYNTQSTDYSAAVLAPYIKEGVVTLVSWPTLPPLVDKTMESAAWALGIQIPAYEHAAKYLAVKESKWLVFLDVNEYLLPAEGTTLKEILNQYDEFPAVTLSTSFFDASKIDQIPKRDLLIQTVELSKPLHQDPLKEIKKMIFKPSLYVQFLWPSYQLIFENGQQPIVASSKEVKINHYGNRFKGYIAGNKIKPKAHIDNRFMPEQEVIALLESGYEIEDQSREIFRFVPILLKKMK